jgi:hypothetical protein
VHITKRSPQYGNCVVVLDGVTTITDFEWADDWGNRCYYRGFGAVRVLPEWNREVLIRCEEPFPLLVNWRPNLDHWRNRYNALQFKRFSRKKERVTVGRRSNTPEINNSASASTIW